MARSKVKPVKVKCSNCARETNHNVLAEEQLSGDLQGIKWWSVYQIIQCRGCEEISFRQVGTSTEDIDPYTGNLLSSESLYPHSSSERKPIEGSHFFPGRTRRIYIEVLKALSHSAPVLAAIGLRALIESICLEQKTKSKTLSKAIDELASMGHLSYKQAAFLHEHRFMGNIAAHEIVPPRPEHLVAALDIAETILKTIYVLPGIAEGLRRSQKRAKT